MPKNLLRKKYLLPGLCTLLAALLCACGGASSSSSMLQPPPPPAPASSSTPPSSSLALPQPYRSPIDFTALQAQNPDIYAWIRIEGTNVDYPILRKPGDDDYYLRRDVQGQESLDGAIYTQASYNGDDFSDPHTVIYGHNMEAFSGEMFSQVHRYQEEAFFNAHREVVVYLPQKELHYRVFAAYEWNDEHLLYSHNPEDGTAYAAYLENILENQDEAAILDESTRLSADDKMLTLSTCASSFPTARRFLVQALLAKVAE